MTNTDIILNFAQSHDNNFARKELSFAALLCLVR